MFTKDLMLLGSLLLLSCTIVNAQAEGLPKWSVGIDVNLLYNEKKQFTQIFEERNDVKLFSERLPSPELRLKVTRIFSNKWLMSGQIIAGAYSLDVNYRVANSFATGASGMFTFNTIEFQGYYGGGIGGGRLWSLSSKDFIRASGNLDFIWFINDEIGLGEGIFNGTTLTGLINPEDFLYYETINGNPDNRLVIAPRLVLAYQRRLGEHWMLELMITGTYTNQKVISGMVALNGDTESLAAEYEKSYRHWGIGVGLNYVLSSY